MRNSAKLTGLVALVAIGGAIGVNCSSNKGGSDGTVKIAVVNAASEGVLTVNYLIHAGTPVPPGPVIPDVTGVINVSDPNATPSVDHSFPASNGDVVTLTATATGGVICTGTSAPFNLAAGGVAQVSVTITCPNGPNNTPNPNTGDIVVTGTFVSTGDNCPLLTSWVASPLQTSGPGGVVTLDGTATDADGDTLAYSWTASKGSFATPFPAATGSASYACPAVAPGTTEMETLSLSVTDNKGCTASLPNTVTIACVGVSVVTGAAGAPATGGTTGAAGAPATGGTTGAAGAPATGGTTGAAGVTGAAGAPATGGTTGNGGIDGAQIACEAAGVGTGVECFGTTGTLADGVTPLPTMGCLGFTGALLQQCNDLQGCLDSAACQTQINAAVANDPGDYPYNDDATPCLCGIGPTAANPSGQTKTQCLGGPPATGWAGVCQAQFAAAAGGAANVAGHFFDRAEPIGIAVNLLTCDVDASCIGL